MKNIAKMVLIAAAFAFVVGCANDRPAVSENVPVKIVKHKKCHHRHNRHHNEKVPVNYDCDAAK